MKITEVHVEHLLGRRVVDVDDRAIGRLEEFRADVVEGELVVTEFHVGGAALIERIAAFVTQLPFFSLIPFARRGYRVSWRDLDLSDPLRPRVQRRRDQLETMSFGRGERAVLPR